jgi:hypothetical protein
LGKIGYSKKIYLSSPKLTNQKSMKRLLLLLLMFPLLGYSQEKNVLSIERITPKADKIMEFEKAMSAHALKFHTGDMKWRVSESMTGPETGSFIITEGPASWADGDTQAERTAEHMTDWNRIFGTLTTGRIEASSLVFRAELSSGNLTDYAEKSSITHLFPRMGFGGKVEANLKKAKKVWEAAGQTVLVYQAISSGEPQYIIVARHKTGWKEKDPKFFGGKTFPERYNDVNGADSFDEYVESIQRFTSKSWGEMLRFRADLSSK